jgi:ketosteroid isomerase-like protein
MSEENVEVVRRLFEAVERRDLAGVIASYDENIVIHEASSLPYGGAYHGNDGAQDHAVRYAQTWDHFQTAAEQKLDAEFLDAGDTVVVLWRQRAARGERKFDSSAASVYRLRNGKIIGAEMFQDTDAVLQFLGRGK